MISICAIPLIGEKLASLRPPRLLLSCPRRLSSPGSPTLSRTHVYTPSLTHTDTLSLCHSVTLSEPRKRIQMPVSGTQHASRTSNSKHLCYTFGRRIASLPGHLMSPNTNARGRGSQRWYRGTSLIRNSAPLGPCSRAMPRVLGGS